METQIQTGTWTDFIEELVEKKGSDIKILEFGESIRIQGIVIEFLGYLTPKRIKMSDYLEKGPCPRIMGINVLTKQGYSLRLYENSLPAVLKISDGDDEIEIRHLLTQVNRRGYPEDAFVFEILSG